VFGGSLGVLEEVQTMGMEAVMEIREDYSRFAVMDSVWSSTMAMGKLADSARNAGEGFDFYRFSGMSSISPDCTG
jgi:hypothetical protein